ncbi:hypothetical protein DXG01_004667, partial [Tephrocybe rancida]
MVKIMRLQTDDSTSNLSRHVLCCEPSVSANENIKTFAHGSKYDPATLQMKLALWVACCSRPYMIVEDPKFRDILQDLDSR